MSDENAPDSTRPQAPESESAPLPDLDLKVLLQNSREAIARAAAEILEEREATSLVATKHTNHSSHSSSSSW